MGDGSIHGLFMVDPVGLFLIAVLAIFIMVELKGKLW